MPGWQRNKPPAPKHTRAQRTRILARDPICRCPGCHKCSTPNRCTRASTEADHILNRQQYGPNHADTNMQGLCTPCHAVKTGREGRAARGTERRQPEQHPGLNP